MDVVQAQWLEQLATMRKAIAELNLPAEAEKAPAYGDDIEFDDDDFSGTASGEDIWDIISDEYEDDYSSDHLEQVQESSSASSAYDQRWLTKRCEAVAQRSSGLDAGALKDQILAILSSDSNDEELQMMLADIVGYEELDLVADLISHRRDVVRSLLEPKPGEESSFSGRLMSRAEREEVLRRQDWEHKNTSLSQAVDRTGPQYPHVYQTFSAGNKLSAYGKKYALPPNHKHYDDNIYEEYEIPAAPVGTLGAGRKLVEISELDGLCQRTFKGYKSLNRMQSLVYPVAYKTSENMLICAPTGAVRIWGALFPLRAVCIRPQLTVTRAKPTLLC